LINIVDLRLMGRQSTRDRDVMRSTEEQYEKGAEPYWPDSAMEAFVKPAVKRAEITKQVGWHTFRPSYSTLLRTDGTDVKVQSELLRHSNIGTTLNLYTQAVSEQKRAANGQVVGQLLTAEGSDQYWRKI
jgi:integrase